jgi:hypothetical protein
VQGDQNVFNALFDAQHDHGFQLGFHRLGAARLSQVQVHPATCLGKAHAR